MNFPWFLRLIFGENEVVSSGSSSMRQDFDLLYRSNRVYLMSPTSESLNGSENEMDNFWIPEYERNVREIARKYNSIELKMNIAEIAATIALLLTAYQLTKSEPNASPVAVQTLSNDKSSLPENANAITDNLNNSGGRSGGENTGIDDQIGQ